MEPYELTVAEAAAQIESRELSPVELVDSALTRIAAVDGHVGAFATVTADAARAHARRAQEELAAGRALGPLHGVPVGIKDLYDTAGVASTSSSRVRASYVPAADSAVGERLRRAGAVMVGKTHTHEFAYGVVTPTTRNPWASDRIPGGSSGGSAAAVAAGMCAVGMGSDTGGSIRIPSALCGTVGIKPTYGRVSRRGVASLSWSLDHVGPLTRTVEDAALVLAAVAGYDRLDPATVDVPVPDYLAGLRAGVAGLTLGVPTNWFYDPVHPEVESAVRTAVGVLEELGARLREVSLPLPEVYMAVEYGLLLPEASAYHAQALRHSGESYGDDVRPLLEAGELVLATDYIRALRARTLVQQGWRQMFEGLDAVVAPTVLAPAARVGADGAEVGGGVEVPLFDAYVRPSVPANLTGLPALSVPCGMTGEGLPIGLQVIGRPFAEAHVLRIGAAYEQATEWGARRPVPVLP